MDRKLIERRQFYTENGYVILRQLFRPECLRSLAQTLRSALPKLENNDQTPSLESEILSAEAADHKCIYNAAQSVGSSAAAYNLLGGEQVLDEVIGVTGFEETSIHVLPMYLIIQLPGDRRFDYGWHQDGAYYPWTEQMTTLWFPVNRPTNAETGTISVIPGSHTDKIRGSETSFRNGYFRQIISEVKQAELQAEVMLDLAPGDCCIMEGNLVHRSISNKAGSPRVAGVVRMINLPAHTPYERDRFYCVHKS
jgi:hypothetical protein